MRLVRNVQNVYSSLTYEISRRGFLKLLRLCILSLQERGLITTIRILINRTGLRQISTIKSPKLIPIKNSLSPNYFYVDPCLPKNVNEFNSSIKFSIVVPVKNTEPRILEELMTSVLDQWYPNWELILSDDNSHNPETLSVLSRSNFDSRIKIIQNQLQSGISGATNSAINISDGDFIIFADHDDLLTVDALHEFANEILSTGADFLYSDEDKVDMQGRFFDPYYKPDWSPDLIMNQMYTGHLSAFRRESVLKIGPLDSSLDGCQDWDFVLRFTELIDIKIKHIPKVLYHWRTTPTSVSLGLDKKDYVTERTKMARERALKRRETPGHLIGIESLPGYFDVIYDFDSNKMTSVIIPSKDNLDFLKRAINSVREKSSGLSLEIIIVDNGSKSVEVQNFCSQNADIYILEEMDFNFSKMCNMGASKANGEILVFLNDDVEIMTQDWLRNILGLVSLPHVGTVGAKLLYPRGLKIQHAGVVNAENGPGHCYSRFPFNFSGYYNVLSLTRNVIANTAALLAIRKEVFEEIDGFREDFPINYNDVELGFRLLKLGKFNVYSPHVVAIHHESISRGYEDTKKKKEKLNLDKRHLYAYHPEFEKNDPFYNINFEPLSVNFEVMPYVPAR